MINPPANLCLIEGRQMASDKLSQKILDLYKYVGDLKSRDASDSSKATEVLSDVIDELQVHLDQLSSSKDELFQDLSEIENNNALREWKRFRVLAEATFECILFTKNGRIIEANEQFARAHGYRLSEVIGRPVTDFIIPEDRERARQSIESDQERIGEYHALRKDGSTFLLEVHGHIIEGDDGQVRISVLRDITNRKRAEEALRSSELKYRSIVEQSRDGIILIDESGYIIEWNPGMEAITGLTQNDALGKRLWDVQLDLIPVERKTPEMYEYIKAAVMNAIVTGRLSSQGKLTEWDIQRPDGTRRVIEEMPSSIATEKGYMLCSILRDITERKKAEQALRESERNFKAIADTSQAAITLYQDGNVVYANDASEAIFGYSLDERSRMKLRELLHPDYREKAEERMKTLLEGESSPPLQNAYKIIRKDGEERWVLSSGSRLTYNGKPAIMTISMDITERKQYEKALKESEEKFRALADSTPNIIFVYRDNRFLYVNPAAISISGYTKEELLTMDFIDIIHPDYHGMIKEGIKARMEGYRGLGHYELKAIKKTGEERWLDVSTNLISYGGSPAGIATCIDITDRKKAEEALKESQTILKTIIESTPDYISLKDREGRYIMLNSAAAERLSQSTGVSAAEIIGKKDDEILPSETARLVMDEDRQVIAYGKMRDLDQSFTVGNNLRTFSTIKSAYRDVSGNVIGVVNVSRDITERKRSEEIQTQLLKKIDEQRGRLQAIVDSLPVGLWIADATGKMVMINDIARRIYRGKAPYASNVEEYNVYNIWWADTGQKIAAEDMPMAHALKGETMKEIAVDFQRFDGTCGTQLVSASPIRDSKGTILGCVAIVQDITERKKAEQALRESRQKYRDLIETTSDFIWEVDSLGRFTYFSPQVEKFWGFRPDELIGKTPFDFMPADDKKCATEIFESAEKSQAPFSGLYTTFYDRQGHLISIETSGVPILGDNGKLLGFRGISRDITERKRMEEELRKAKDKLELRVQERTADLAKTNEKLLKAKDAAEEAVRAKAAFLANMSHEIRTPMNAVIGMTDLMLGDALTPEQKENLELIRTNGDALLTIINDILDFSKTESDKLVLEEQPFELQHLVEEALDLVGFKAAEKGLNLEYIFDKNTPETIIGDPGRLRQVLGNLLSNAIKFTDEGEVTLSVSANGLNEIHFAVQDTGIGIPQDRMTELFQPFNQMEPSTHRLYGGTGLGLAISKNLVELMGGRIWAESEVGKGSTFRFTIKTTGQSEPRPSEVSPILIGKRMLIVSENKTNRSILSRQAYDWSMVSVSATSGLEALKYIYRGDDFDITILDIDLKGMSSLELEQDIRKYNKTLPLILLTPLEQRIPPGHAYLTKPIKPDQLQKVLIDILSTVQPVQQGAQMATIGRLGQSKPLRILLAEDNVSSQKVTLGMLKRLGYKADIAANGIEVLQALERQPYDVVLMDIEMPEMDGFEASRLIRRRWQNDGLKIIAITAYAIQGDREKCLEAGMDDYIAKPVKMGDIAEVLKRYSQ